MALDAFLYDVFILSTDADLTDTYVPSNDPSTSVQALEGRVPNYLLLVSLLEHLCSLYEADPEKSKKIFNGKIKFLKVIYSILHKCTAESGLTTTYLCGHLDFTATLF